MRSRRAPRFLPLLLAFVLALGALHSAQAARPSPRRALDEDDTSPAEKASVSVAEALGGSDATAAAGAAGLPPSTKANKGSKKPKAKKLKPPPPLPEELVRGAAVEAKIEEEIAEFEEAGGLAVSVVVWVVAIAAPLSLLVFLRLRTNLLGATPAGQTGSAVLSALEGATGGTPGKAAPGKTEPTAKETQPSQPLSKAAMLRQLEEENMRLRQAMSPAAAAASPNK